VLVPDDRAVNERARVPEREVEHVLVTSFGDLVERIGAAWEADGTVEPLRVYSHMMRRSDEEREELKALVERLVLAGNRQGARISPPHGVPEDHF
jgi:hypothetical protein